jgi:cytidylate kinase
MINYTFRNLAQEKSMELKQLLDMAEIDSSWDRFLDDKQAELASVGNCVLGSRLAIWILESADLKVYLTASPETRARRIWEREREKRPGLLLDDILVDTALRDKNDRERYLRLYGIDNDDFGFADLIIDTTTRDPRMVLDDIMLALANKKLV